MKNILAASLLLLATSTILSGQTVADSQRQALAKYPALAQEGSPLHGKFLALYNDAKQNNPKLLSDSNWPIILADRAAQPGETAAQLLRRADTALTASDFAGAAEALNRVKSDYSSSLEASIALTLRDTIRDKQHRHDGPFTPDEGKRIRALMDAWDRIKISYPKNPPEKQRALEKVFGADLLQDSSKTLESFAKASAKLTSALDIASKATAPEK
jgi:hypothetical protein